jgi:hypothetical protein
MEKTMKAAMITAGCLVAGLLIALVGALSHAQRAGNNAGWANEPSDGWSNEPTPPRRETPKPEKITLPGTVPGSTEGVVISNSGIAVAVSRFYRLLQDPKLGADTVLAAPFLLDGRKEMQTAELQPFIDKARDGSLQKKTTNTLLGITVLPAGNNWEEAQRWLAPIATGERAKALFDHAEKHKAALVRVLLARAPMNRAVSYEYALIAVIEGDNEDKARVIGFID